MSSSTGRVERKRTDLTAKSATRMRTSASARADVEAKGRDSPLHSCHIALELRLELVAMLSSDPGHRRGETAKIHEETMPSLSSLPLSDVSNLNGAW
jgi:hypothetical protein